MSMNYGKYLQWLIMQPAGSVEWHSTKRDLVELVAIVAERRLIKDDRGLPLSQRKLAQLAFTAVGMKSPKNVAEVVLRIRNRVTVMPPLEKRIGCQAYCG